MRRRELLQDNDKFESMIDEFLGKNCAEIVDYEFIYEIQIKHHDFSRFRILEVELDKKSRLDLEKLGVDSGWMDTFASNLKEFVSASVTERGAHLNVAEGRARLRVKGALELLAYIASHSRVLHDWQLDYRLGSHYFGRRLPDGRAGGGWQRLGTPLPNVLPKIDEAPYAQSQEMLSELQKLPLAVRRSVELAIHWYKQALRDQSWDLKVIAICTALEAMLSTKHDRMKGEVLAFRTMSLMFHFKHHTVLPETLLRIYVLRSDVVHGTAVGIATQGDYYTMRMAVRDVIARFVQFAHDTGAGRPSRILDQLDRCEGAVAALAWLKARATESEGAGYILKVITPRIQATDVLTPPAPC